MSGDHVDFYEEHGYAVVRNVFGRDEVAELARAFDRHKAEGIRHHASFRHQNILYVIAQDPRLGHILRFLQWPSYIDPTLNRYRVDRRLFDIIAPLIGINLKQIINQLIWKPPGATAVSFAYHQDCRFRRPASCFRDLAESYLQTAIAIDPHRPENGAMRVYPGSHRLGDLGLGLDASVREAPFDENALRHYGLNPSRLVDLIVEPGDVALWHSYMVHGSGPNRSNMDRRFYVNGYVTAENSDRGEWAFREGEPCGLGDPVLVHYEDLFTRPEPHYIDGPPHPYRPEGDGV